MFGYMFCKKIALLFFMHKQAFICPSNNDSIIVEVRIFISIICCIFIYSFLSGADS